MIGMLYGLKGNPIFAGLVGTMAMGSLLYLLRTIPAKLLLLLYDAFTVRLVLTSDDAIFDCVNEWFADHTYAQRARRLKVSTKRNSDDDYALAPGVGKHLLWDNGPLLLERVLSEKSQGMMRPLETYTITTFGRSQARIRQIIEQANGRRSDRARLGVRVWHSGWWQPIPARSKRPIESLYLPHDVKEELLAKVAWFFGAKDWFVQRGVPYRYGVMLHGITGSGKSTTVSAVASHFGKPVYIINLASIENDNALLSAFISAPPSCVILLEDIDCIAVAQSRVDQTPAPVLADGAAAPKSSEQKGVTLSGLLNAIDGIAATEGRLLFMTTNHLEKLDSALIREARIDLTIEVGAITPELVGEMATRFFPGERYQPEQWVMRARLEGPRAAAFWQKRMMDFHVDTRR